MAGGKSTLVLAKNAEGGIRPRPRGSHTTTPSGLALIEQKENRESSRSQKVRKPDPPKKKPTQKGKSKAKAAVQEAVRSKKTKRKNPTAQVVDVDEEDEQTQEPVRREQTIETDVVNEEEQNEEEEQEGEEEEEEEPVNKPSFISEMKMRTKRGTKVDKLLKNESVGYDAFWEENKYFGKVDDLSDDSEEYDFEKELNNKGGKDGDSFDSDFGVSSESSDDEAEDAEGDGNDTARGKRDRFIEDKKLSRSAGYDGKGNSDGKSRIKKKKKQYTMNLDIEKEVVKVASKKEEKKKKVIKKDLKTEWKPRFIHEIYTQEKLLRDAVAQEYLNKYDLVV